MSRICIVIVFFIIAHRSAGCPVLQYPSLVERFYQQRHQALFWFGNNETAGFLRRELLSSIDSAAWVGLDSNKYQPELLRQMDHAATTSNAIDSIRLSTYDRLYTDVAFAYSAGLLRGDGIDSMFSYDGVAPAKTGSDEQFLLNGLSAINSPASFRTWIAALEAATWEDTVLKTAIRQYLDSASGQNDSLHLSGNARASTVRRIRELSISINVLRLIRHYHFDRYVVVNIPSASLSYFSADTLALSMKVVAGQVSKRTPRFAAFCNRLILYPYWNIPRKIAVRELLPLFRKEPGLAALMNIQALDRRGRKIDITRISWASYTAADFPYSLREAPGCDNALGVLKFDINSPYDVYMHDTNLKGAFSSGWRYLSHGCIRLERPLDLGMLLTNNRLDTAFLRSCLRDQAPIPIPLEKPVPVFVVYLTAMADSAGRLAWYKDVYHLLK